VVRVVVRSDRIRWDGLVSVNGGVRGWGLACGVCNIVIVEFKIEQQD